MANLEIKQYRYKVLKAGNGSYYVLNIFGRRLPCETLLANSKDLLFDRVKTLYKINLKGELQVFLNNELVATHNRNKNKKRFDDWLKSLVEHQC